MNSNEITAPTKQQIAALAPFGGIPIDQIVVPKTPKDVVSAYEDLIRNKHLGFDTESQPTFKKGQISEGPHVVQLSTPDKAYIFQLDWVNCAAELEEILSSTDIVKVGFGLKSDLKLIRQKLGINPQEVLDLNTIFRRQGYRREIGIKAAIAVLFNRRFMKSKSVAMSNWSRKHLQNDQVLYAGNDAHAALCIFSAMKLSEGNT